MSRIRCMDFSGRVKSLKNSGHAHNSDAIECDPNYRSAMHKHLCKRLTAFHVLSRVMHVFEMSLDE